MCAVREAGIPPAVRARILTENKSIARSKGYVRPLRMRTDLLRGCKSSIQRNTIM